MRLCIVFRKIRLQNSRGVSFLQHFFWTLQQLVLESHLLRPLLRAENMLQLKVRLELYCSTVYTLIWRLCYITSDRFVSSFLSFDSCIECRHMCKWDSNAILIIFENYVSKTICFTMTRHLANLFTVIYARIGSEKIPSDKTIVRIWCMESWKSTYIELTSRMCPNQLALNKEPVNGAENQS